MVRKNFKRGVFSCGGGGALNGRVSPEGSVLFVQDEINLLVLFEE